MNALVQNLESSITGNIPKAILCVREMTPNDSEEGVIQDGISLQKKLLEGTRFALEEGAGGSTSASKTFGTLTGQGGAMSGSGYLAMEVQYNPSSIRMETQAGLVDYAGGNLGDQSINQMTQVNQSVSTIMSFQLIFDDMNPFDAFMLENLVPTTVGNTVSLVGSEVQKKKGGYSVQDQVDGLMALLTQDVTRQVIFFWAEMCFRGALTDVRTRYTMFNKDGNPIRGVVDLSICQGNDPKYGYDTTYWNKAFTNAFGKAAQDEVRGEASTLSKWTNNNFLNLNL